MHACRTENFPEAEIADFDVVVGIYEDVGGLDVTVQNAAAVCVLQALCELDQKLPETVFAEEGPSLRVAPDEALQIAPAGKLHDNVQRALLQE